MLVNGLVLSAMPFCSDAERLRMKKNIFIALLIVLAVFIYFRQENKDYYDYLIVSGATPLAIAQRVPAEISLTIDGLVKKKYQFSGDALNALATTRIRTREISPDGEFLGAYIHLGIPVFNILEGISPQKPDHYLFDQPLDILVSFHADSGQQVCFSFNEIIMADDRLPVTLAFSRKPLLPTNETVQKTYAANRYEADIEGLRLICPKDPDTARYLDNVTRISYSVIDVNEGILPVRKKKFKCDSDSISCSNGNQTAPGVFESVAVAFNRHWLRIGHGHGFDEIADAKGYDLRSFLKTNFPDCIPDDYFLFVACDGYRALFSGREIFLTADGAGMMIVDRLNGQRPEGGYMLAPTRDYFSDRAMWGIAHILRIPQDRLPS